MTCQPLTTEERIALRARITVLQTAYDSILAGTAIKRFVDQNGEQVEYNTANASRLLAYINELQSQLDCAFAKRFRPRPVGFIFPR